MTLYDLTVKQVESWVAVYKRRLGGRPLLHSIDILIPQLLAAMFNSVSGLQKLIKLLQ